MKAKNSFDFWPNGKNLQFVNKDKFDNEEILKKIGWSSINTTAITDAKSIKIRQDGLKLLLENHELSQKIHANYLPRYKYEGRDFFQVFGKDSPFNRETANLLKSFDEGVNNQDADYRTKFYSKINDELTEEFRDIIQKENEVISTIIEDFVDVYCYDGTIKFNSVMDKKTSTPISSKVYGYQEYAFYKGDDQVFKTSEWINDLYKRNISNYGWFGKILLVIGWLFFAIPFAFAQIILSLKEKVADDALYTSVLPNSLYRELKRINENLIEKIEGELNQRLSGVKFFDSTKIKELKEYLSVQTEYQFSLRPSTGLSVRIIALKHNYSIPKHFFLTNRDDWNGQFNADTEYFGRGYSLYSKIKGWIYQERLIKFSITKMHNFLEMVIKKSIDGSLLFVKDLLESGKNTISTMAYLEVMDEVKYSNVTQAINAMGYQQDFEEILNFRQKIKNFIDDLSEIKRKADVIKQSIGNFKNINYCFPEIVDDDKNIVSFQHLMPMHLLGQQNQNRTGVIKENDLRPITGLPPLNGQIVSITGQNGGGKTVAEIELVHAISLAHMGYPVFAKSFMLNTKDIVAMVFVEKGQGSLLQLIMEKMTKIAEAVKASDKNRVVIIIDELLTGTQERSALEIGRKYLKMLSDHKCSVMFVTQITDLAKYAELELNALCFHYNKEGELRAGIGSGNPEFLAEKVGLAEHLAEY